MLRQSLSQEKNVVIKGKEMILLELGNREEVEDVVSKREGVFSVVVEGWEEGGDSLGY